MRCLLPRLAELALILAAIVCLALTSARIAANISFTTPLQLVTSGAEQEALDSIWRFAHGQSIYTDPHAIPYTANCFNWLFYAVYGSIAEVVLRIFHLGDGWLPTVCRVVTLGFAILGAGILLTVLRFCGGVRIHIAAAWGVVAFLNPLCGFWIITARPDMGAAMLELLGVAFFFRYLRGGGLRWIVFAALALYGAWAFKQTSLSALAGVLVMLLLFRHGWALSALLMIWLGGIAATVAVSGPVYRQELFFGQIHSGYDLGWSLDHLTLAVLKMPLIAVSAAAAPWAWRRNRNAVDPIRCATAWILAITLGWELLLGTKGGGGDYYFIPLGVWAVLGLGLRVGRSGKDQHLVPPSDAERSTTPGRTPRASPSGVTLPIKCPELIFDLAVIGAAMLILLDGALILGGRCGTIDCRDPRQPYEHLAHYLAMRPGPVFVEDTYGDLPWISTTSPHFVVAYNNGPTSARAFRSSAAAGRACWPTPISQPW